MSERAYAWSEIPHLAKRTVWSLRKPAPDPDGQAWLVALLTEAEQALYWQMDEVDRAHAIGCAVAVENEPTEVIVASALHDVGKVDASLGTPGRVVATLCGLFISERAQAWPPNRRGLRGRIARYLDHADRGVTRLTAAGASQLAIDWAREHHLPEDKRTMAPEMWGLLHEADEIAD
ncbi:MAG: hypothetical protein AAF567_17345 [Actinomycetota bacterium]